MNRKIRISLLAFIALSILGLAVSVFVHYQTRNSVSVSFNEDNKLEVRIDRVHYSGTKDGRVEWELAADSAVRIKDEDAMVFSSVTVTFYPKTGEPYILKAREGRFMESKGEIHASGAVRVESKEGFTMETESVRYDIESKEITSKEKVSITSGMMDVEGRGFFADIDTWRFMILNDVKAVVKDAAA